MQRVRLIWEECAGPGRAARAQGLGHAVFERIGASVAGGHHADFRPEGFLCTLDIGAENLLRPGLACPVPAAILAPPACPARDTVTLVVSNT